MAKSCESGLFCFSTHCPESFLGHIGGDDFFVALRAEELAPSEESSRIEQIIHEFTVVMNSVYQEAELQKDAYLSKDRKGRNRQFELLSVSAAIIEIPKGPRCFSQDEIITQLTKLKKAAKASRRKICFFRLDKPEENIASFIQPSP